MAEWLLQKLTEVYAEQNGIGTNQIQIIRGTKNDRQDCWCSDGIGRIDLHNGTCKGMVDSQVD